MVIEIVGKFFIKRNSKRLVKKCPWLSSKAFACLYIGFILPSGAYADHPVEICREPYAIAYTPNSILDNNQSQAGILYAGDRPRYSTCSAVCWLKDDTHLLCVNMHGCSFNIYSFDSNKQTLLPQSCFDNTQGAQLARPEAVDISNKWDFIVVPNMSSGQISFYNVLPEKSINSVPIAQISSKKVHGIRLSRDNRYIVATSFSPDIIGGINVYSIESGNFRHVQNFKHPSSPMKAKSVEFSKNGQFIIIGSCMQLSGSKHKPKGTIAVYRFDAETGIIGDIPVSKINSVVSVETLHFHPSGAAFFGVDQVEDKLVGYEFDQLTGQIGKQWVALDGKTSKLNMPHGVAFSHSGRYVAVTSYGDDKVCIYKVISP